jgi:hypothetical protein
VAEPVSWNVSELSLPPPASNRNVYGDVAPWPKNGLPWTKSTVRLSEPLPVDSPNEAMAAGS